MVRPLKRTRGGSGSDGPIADQQDEPFPLPSTSGDSDDTVGLAALTADDVSVSNDYSHYRC